MVKKGKQMSKTEYYKFLVSKVLEHFMQHSMEAPNINKDGKITIIQKGYNSYILIDKLPYVKQDSGTDKTTAKMICASSRGLAYKETPASEWKYAFEYDENMEKSVLSKLIKNSLDEIFELK